MKYGVITYITKDIKGFTLIEISLVHLQYALNDKTWFSYFF